MLWFSLVIPTILTIYLFVFHRKALKWWEPVTLYIATLIFIGIAIIAVEGVQTTDTEYWGNFVNKACYYERWNEEEIYYEDCNCRKVKSGDSYYEECDQCRRTRTIDHPEYWEAVMDSGQTFLISEVKFNELIKRWKNKKFKDMHRDYDTKDGDCYFTTWGGKRETAEVAITTHRYTNKVQASDSVFNYPEITDEEAVGYGLIQYPRVKNNWCPTVIGVKDLKDKAKIEKTFDYLQAKLGPTRQLRVWVLLYKNKPRNIAKEQEAYWKGGNKNEFIFCIGIDKENKVKWCDIISWTEIQDIKVEARKTIENMDKLDLYKVAEFVEGPLNKKWKRKEFADFDYLRVTPPLWSVLTVFALTLLINIIVGIWVVKNNYTD